MSSLFEESANQCHEKQSTPGLTPVPSPGLIAYLDTSRRVFRTANTRRSRSTSSCASPATSQTSDRVPAFTVRHAPLGVYRVSSTTSILLHEYVADVGVIVVKPVLVLTACASEDFEGRGLDDISQLTPSLQSEPQLGDDEAVICPTIGIADRLGYQHVLSFSPPDENIVQQMPAPRPRVHPRGLHPRRKLEEGVGQQETVFRTRAQKKEAVIVTSTETVGTQHSLPGSVVRPDAGIEVTKGK
ncbi:unnamed protein product [Schistocephalus solidus]|uniref:Uncharacterized protein n=1 Tax=Schistocephalus solidus TaxID=70667 RepID=A0A183TP03_SCHSO|nr:unnamed protein product [Schistocephalus solidus]